MVCGLFSDRGEVAEVYYNASMAQDRSPDDRPREAPRKDRLVQTRVPRHLEATLKHEAQRRRVSVSQLIRNVLEDAFQLVDGVVTDVDQIVQDSLHLARNVRRSAQRMASPDRPSEARDADIDADIDSGPGDDESDDLAHVYAWNELVLHRPAACSGCDVEIARGERGYAGLSDDPKAPRVWLCAHCASELG